jgi:very-short-patch-repair endonuclease
MRQEDRMSTTSTLAMLAVAGIAAVVVAGAIKAKLARQGGAGSAPAFKAKALLTANELEFLLRLEAAAPELRFHAQVSMGALIQPATPRNNGKEYFRARGMFSQKIVDFVAQRKSDGSVVAIVELDDRTHSVEKDAKRDSMLTAAGYRTLRWSSKAKPNEATIRAQLNIERSAQTPPLGPAQTPAPPA